MAAFFVIVFFIFIGCRSGRRRLARWLLARLVRRDRQEAGRRGL
jgi:hypothetical protein